MPKIPQPEVRDSDFGEFQAAAASIDKIHALAHYTALAREAQALLQLRSQQRMRDELFANWLDEPPSDFEASAEEYARDELASTPRVIADWLQEETADMACRDSVDDYRLQRTDPFDWTAAQCLVMLMRGDQQSVRLAAIRLRELFDAANGAAAKERGAEILREYVGGVEA